MLPCKLWNLGGATFQPQQGMKSAKQESQPRLKKGTTGKAALSNSDQRGDLHADKREKKQCTLKKLVSSSQQRKATLQWLSAPDGLACTSRLIHLVPVTSHFTRVMVLEGRPSISSLLKS